MRKRLTWWVVGMVLAASAGAALLTRFQDVSEPASPGLTAPASPPSQARIEVLRVGGRFGQLTVVRPPSGMPTTVALLLADGPADRGRGAELASALAEHGALVLGVDANTYLRSVEKGKRCAYPAGDLEVLSQGYQRHEKLPEYLHPVVVGDGPGAALAFVALEQSPPGTFRGAVSVGFGPERVNSTAFCRGTRLARPVEGLSEPWVVLVAGDEPAHTWRTARGRTRELKATRVEVVPAPGPRHGAVASWKGQLLSAYDTAAVPLTSERRASAPAAVGDLPLVEVPAAKPEGDTLALFVSGDGGWASVDQQVSASLVEQGIPVVGLNSLRYFWKRRTPEETSADVARVLRHYLTGWGLRRVVLVGYSRGADVVPAIAAGLPPDLRERVRGLALLAPGKEAGFEVHVTDLFGGASGATHPILPDIQSLGGMPVLCLYGDEELAESLCPTLSHVPGAHPVMLAGGHHFNGDYASIARVILQALDVPAHGGSGPP
ncbi:virulence factor family protein [Archangium violaceum]|uniref:virulence factor family protein n=1 Tax=Archangium violaceum TaxID=83451 RepID=UPI0036DF10E7